MPLVRTLRNRGTTVTVVAHGELLFTPTGDIARWNRSLSNKVRGAASREAPANKRPRWNHYGKPLKSTMRAKTDIDAATMTAHAAVGSVAPHGYYVDQGTGVFAGGSPWQAKVLPPWKAMGYRFYEHTWRPGGGKNRVKPVMIDGQRGKFFLDAGLKAGFRAMRIPVGAANPALIGKAFGLFPQGLENFFGNTPIDAAFKAQRDLWRAERDEAWLSERKARSEAADARYRTKRAEAALVQGLVKANDVNTRRAEAKANLEASRAAAARRAEAQAARIRAQRERAEEAKRSREEKAAQTRAADRLSRGNARMRREAMDFLNRIRQMYPNATLLKYRLDDGVMLYRVTYVTSDGETVRQQWAYGYET